MNKKCEMCGVIFKIKPSRENTAVTCSVVCKLKRQTGRGRKLWKGGRMIHKGYVYILQRGHPNSNRDGYVSEHRLVMEKQLGRFLTRKEVVHHKNHIRDDNRIENLGLMQSQSEHFKKHLPEIMEINRSKPHPMLGRKHTEETKLKISKIHKGKKLSPQQRKQMSDSRMGSKNHFFGKRHTEESKRKISRVFTEETKMKMRLACAKRKLRQQEV